MAFKDDWYKNLNVILKRKSEIEKSLKDGIKNNVENVDSTETLENTMNTLVSSMGEPDAVMCLEKCGACCFGKEMIETVGEIMKELKDIDKVIEKLNEMGIAGGQMYREGNEIHVIYKKCFCPMAEEEKNIPDIFCNCSRGWILSLFRNALQKDVKVFLLESIIRGGGKCEFIVHMN